MTTVLFICSKNQWRSPTAERVYRDEPGLSVRSRGVSSKARRTVTARDLEWADLVLVMEAKHKRRLLQDFAEEMQDKDIEILDVPDVYRFMDPDLVERLIEAVEPLFE